MSYFVLLYYVATNTSKHKLVVKRQDVLNNKGKV